MGAGKEVAAMRNWPINQNVSSHGKELVGLSTYNTISYIQIVDFKFPPMDLTPIPFILPTPIPHPSYNYRRFSLPNGHLGGVTNRAVVGSDERSCNSGVRNVLQVHRLRFIARKRLIARHSVVQSTDYRLIVPFINGPLKMQN